MRIAQALYTAVVSSTYTTNIPYICSSRPPANTLPILLYVDTKEKKSTPLTRERAFDASRILLSAPYITTPIIPFRDFVTPG